MQALKDSGRFPGAVYLADLNPAFGYTCYTTEPMSALLGGVAVKVKSTSAWTDNSDIFGAFGTATVANEAAELAFFNEADQPIGKVYTYNTINLDMATFGDFRESNVAVGGTRRFRDAAGSVKVRTVPVSASAVQVTSLTGKICAGGSDED